MCLTIKINGECGWACERENEHSLDLRKRKKMRRVLFLEEKKKKLTLVLLNKLRCQAHL